MKDPVTQKHRRVLLCNACGLKFRKGHYCNYCYEMYRDVFEIQHDNENNRTWVKCNNCMNWIHTQCCINNNGYRPLQAPNDSNRIYLCSTCNKNSNNQSFTAAARRRSSEDLDLEVLNQGTIISHTTHSAPTPNYSYPPMGYPPQPTAYHYFPQPTSVRVLNPSTEQSTYMSNTSINTSYSYPPTYSMYEMPSHYPAPPHYPIQALPTSYTTGSTEDRKRKLSPRSNGSSNSSSSSGNYSDSGSADKDQEPPISKKLKNDLLKYSLVDPMNLTTSPTGPIALHQETKMFPLPNNISGKAIIEKMFEEEKQDQTSASQQLPSFSSLIQQAENRPIKAEDDTK